MTVMERISIYVFFYIVCALITFFGMWKEIERDDIDIYEKPRWKRISIRLLVLLVWPVFAITALVGIVWRGIKRFVEAFIE